MAQRQRLSAEVAIEGLLDPSFTRAFSKMNNGLRGVTDKIDGIGKEQKQLFRQRDEWLKMGKSVDHFDKAIDKSNRSLKTQLRLMDRLHVERLRASRQRLGSAVQGIRGAALPVAIGAGLAIAGIAKATGGMVDFEFTLAQVQTQAGLTDDAISGVGRRVRDIAKSAAGFDPGDIATGLLTLTKAGKDVEESLTILPAVLDLATAQGISFDDALRGSLAVMNAFGTKVGDIGSLVESFRNTANSASLSIPQMNESLADATSAFALFGSTDYDGMLTWISLLADAEVRGGRAGTAIAGALRQMVAKQDDLAELGVTIADMEGNLRSPIKIIEDLGKAFATLTEAERTKKINEIFGETGTLGVGQILKKLQTDPEVITQRLEMVMKEGTLAKDVEGMSKTLRIKLATISSLWQEFLLTFSETVPVAKVLDAVTDGIKKLTSWLERNKEQVTDTFTKAWEVTTTFFGALASGINFVRSHKDIFAGIAVGILVFYALTKGLELVTAAAVVTRGALIALTAANPIVLAIAAVAGIAAYFVIKHWDAVKGFMLRLWDKIATFADDAWERIKTAVTPVVEFLKVVWKPIGTLFKILWEIVQISALAAWNVIRFVFGKIREHWGLIKKLFSFTPFGMLIKFGKKAFEALRGPAEAFFNFIDEKLNWFLGILGKLKGLFGGDDGEQVVDVKMNLIKDLEMKGLDTEVAEKTVADFTDALKSEPIQQNLKANLGFGEEQLAKPLEVLQTITQNLNDEDKAMILNRAGLDEGLIRALAPQDPTVRATGGVEVLSPPPPSPAAVPEFPETPTPKMPTFPDTIGTEAPGEGVVKVVDIPTKKVETPEPLTPEAPIVKASEVKVSTPKVVQVQNQAPIVLTDDRLLAVNEKILANIIKLQDGTLTVDMPKADAPIPTEFPSVNVPTAPVDIAIPTADAPPLVNMEIPTADVSPLVNIEIPIAEAPVPMETPSVTMPSVPSPRELDEIEGLENIAAPGDRPATVPASPTAQNATDSHDRTDARVVNQTNNITINTAPGTDEEELARRVLIEIERLQEGKLF